MKSSKIKSLLSSAFISLLSLFFLTAVKASADLGTSNLVDIQKVNPNILIDLRYATPDNFTGEVVYTFHKCYLRKEVADALSAVQKDLEGLELGIKVWDGYRTMEAQTKFWELVPDERYVSPPSKGGRHTRGTAVDLTLVYADGTELAMPSMFDEFSELAHRDYMNLPKEVIDNRNLLEEVMKEHGFIGLDTEWWHFDYQGWKSYDIPAVDIAELE